MFKMKIYKMVKCWIKIIGIGKVMVFKSGKCYQNIGKSGDEICGKGKGFVFVKVEWVWMKFMFLRGK